jgi:hypothetical protein
MAVAALAEWYPQRPPEQLKGYMRALAQDLATFSPHIVERALIEVRRNCKFIPSISEVYQAARRMQEELHRMVEAVNATEREHARREEETERRMKAEADEAERIERFEEAIARLQSGQKIGKDDLDAGATYLRELADLGGLSEGRERCWQKSLAACHPSTLRFALRVALLLRIRRLATIGPAPLNREQLREVIRLARSNEETARQRLVELERSPPCGGEPFDGRDLRRAAIAFLEEALEVGC